MTMKIITGVLGWCSVINLTLLVFSAVFIMKFKKKIAFIHGKMFDLDENELSKVYISTLANYEIAIIVFNLVPYIALKIMG